MGRELSVVLIPIRMSTECWIKVRISVENVAEALEVIGGVLREEGVIAVGPIHI